MENEKWGDNVLLVQLNEARNGDVHFVGAPNKVSFCFFLLILDTFRNLVVFEGFFDWIWYRLKCFEFI